ncbi:MAG: CrcB family protein [Hydrogenophaga sp.]|nr:CrcB family protein [Hydrogenophaga sp.]
MINVLLIFVGAGMGGLCRYAAWAFLGKSIFALSTLLVNCLGCFFAGVVIAIAQRFSFSSGLYIFLVPGFLGGFTTFSTFSMESLMFFLRGQYVQAGTYAVGTLVACLGMVFVGHFGARFILSKFLF